MPKAHKGNISKKSKMIAATAFILGMLAISGTTFAETVPETRDNTLVSTIAKRFDLNPADVETVIDQVREERGQKRSEKFQKTFEDHIADEVGDGTLTQTQADLIIAKEKELQNSFEALKDKTPQERHAAMKTEMQNLKQWIADNNIPPHAIRFWGHGKGPGHWMNAIHS